MSSPFRDVNLYSFPISPPPLILVVRRYVSKCNTDCTRGLHISVLRFTGADEGGWDNNLVTHTYLLNYVLQDDYQISSVTCDSTLCYMCILLCIYIHEHKHVIYSQKLPTIAALSLAMYPQQWAEPHTFTLILNIRCTLTAQHWTDYIYTIFSYHSFHGTFSPFLGGPWDASIHHAHNILPT